MEDENLVDEDTGAEEIPETYETDYSGFQTVNVTSTRIADNQSVAGKPSIRKNVLGEYSSYTYNLSLYMVSRDGLNKFETNGRKNVNQILGTSAFLICQSGGINERIPRAPGFELDYYIDDVKIKGLIAPNSTGASVAQTEINFQIYEPYGFSFLTNLKKTWDKLLTNTPSINDKQQKNPTRAFYLLGIKFKGYDKNGNELPQSQLNLPDTYYPIVINNVSFKIDGKTTTYNIKALSLGANEALTLKRARINKNVNMVAQTVEEALIGDNNLIDQLNQFEKDLGYSDGGPINRYNIVFAGDSIDISLLKNAKLNLKNNNEKNHLPFSPAENLNQVNEANSLQATPDTTKRTITLAGGSTIIQAIERVVVQSNYLTDALKVVYDSEYEPDGSKKNYDSELSNNPKRKISWYNVSPKVTCLGYNTKINDYAWDITYIISTYQTPVVLNAYSNDLMEYYGPLKRYEYWYTGKNSEVINYEQVNNNGYYITVVKPDKNTTVDSGQTAVSVKPGQSQGFDQTGAKGVGQEAQAAYLTSLFDPKSYSKAKITILGDPDFLMYDQLSPQALQVYQQFYDFDPNRINPLAGQVFIEVNFKEAVDYNNSTGTLDINDQIVFWQYPDYIKRIVNGVSFLVTQVESNFSKGKFIQTLDCNINVFPKQKSKTNSQVDDTSEGQREGQGIDGDRDYNSEGSGPNASGGGTTENTGLLPDPTQADIEDSEYTQDTDEDALVELGQSGQPDDSGTSIIEEDGRGP